MQCSFTRVPYDSDEMAVLQQYVNQSSANSCTLAASEPRASPLHSEFDFDILECVMALKTYPSSDLKSNQCVTLYPSSHIVIVDEHEKYYRILNLQTMRLMYTGNNKATSASLTPISLNEAMSKVASIHRIARLGDGPSTETCAYKYRSLLFHGSNMENLVGILEGGLKIKPPGVYHSGSAFDEGIYFANKFSKSQNYCSYHNHKGFMLLCEVKYDNPLKGGLLWNNGFAHAVNPKAAYNDVVYNLEGTPYDAAYVMSREGPNENKMLIHPQHGY